MSFTKKHATYISMITLFAKNGRVIKAQQLFDRTSHKNIISWNNMIVGHLHNNTVEQANKLFELMFKKGNLFVGFDNYLLYAPREA